MEPDAVRQQCTFSWTHQEEDVIYQIIRTTGRVHPMAEPTEYENDPEYTSFLAEYDPPEEGEAPEDRGVFLDPEGDPEDNFPGKFTYDRTTGLCTFTVDRGMFPNRLYYFSLKAIRTDADRKPLKKPSHSVWVSIPVTTSFIEAPSMLEAIPGAEIGFFWTDPDPAYTAEDYTIYIKGPEKLLTSRCLKLSRQSSGCGQKDLLRQSNRSEARNILRYKSNKGNRQPLFMKDGLHNQGHTMNWR